MHAFRRTRFVAEMALAQLLNMQKAPAIGSAHFRYLFIFIVVSIKNKDATTPWVKIVIVGRSCI